MPACVEPTPRSIRSSTVVHSAFNARRATSVRRFDALHLARLLGRGHGGRRVSSRVPLLLGAALFAVSCGKPAETNVAAAGASGAGGRTESGGSGGASAGKAPGGAAGEGSGRGGTTSQGGSAGTAGTGEALGGEAGDSGATGAGSGGAPSAGAGGSGAASGAPPDALGPHPFTPSTATRGGTM